MSTVTDKINDLKITLIISETLSEQDNKFLKEIPRY